jgi:DNA-binding NtrC family response regulator
MVGQPGSNGVAALAAAVQNAGLGPGWPAPPAAPRHNLDEMERRMIEEALAATGGHQQKAAARLGISRRTLSRKLKRYQGEEEQQTVGLGAAP